MGPTHRSTPHTHTCNSIRGVDCSRCLSVCRTVAMQACITSRRLERLTVLLLLVWLPAAHLHACCCHRPPVSPYASRPAPPGTPEQQQQQRWLRQQWQQQCSPGGQQQQQQRVANTAMPEAPQAASEADVQAEATADDWDALTYPLPVAPRELEQLLHSSSAAKRQPQQQASVTPVGAGSVADAASAAQHAEQDSVSAAAPTGYSPPAVQDFYMLTSRPRVSLAGSSMLPAPLRVSLLTDSDMLALQQHAQQQQQQWHGTAPHSSSSGGGCGFEEPPELDFDFDLFCSSSVGRDMMSLSMVVRESAELDNVFVGLTTPSQADQRGLQVGGWWRPTQKGTVRVLEQCCAVLHCVVLCVCCVTWYVPARH